MAGKRTISPKQRAAMLAGRKRATAAEHLEPDYIAAHPLRKKQRSSAVPYKPTSLRAMFGLK